MAQVLVLGLSYCPQPVYAGSNDRLPFGQMGSLGKPIQFLKDRPTLEQMLPRTNFPYSYPQPLPLTGIRIRGLSPKAIEMLGANYFVVVNNTSYPDMAALYRDNRLQGKSNFVTADSILNPYFAFTNASLVASIEQHASADLDSLLKAMLAVALWDYKQTDDEHVRNDVVANIAFLSVALQLLDPSFVPPEVDLARALVAQDVKAARAGLKAHSAIFDQQVDFSCFKMLGWRNASSQVANFLAAHEWLSRMSYPISETTFGTQPGKGNNFRRSVLLFRCLDLATVGGKPAWETWNKLNRFFGLLGQPLIKFQEETLLPPDYKSQLKAVLYDLKVTLGHLAEPFFRTKLLLAIRKPVKLHATSVFELNEADKASDLVASFRFFPVIGEPEIGWLKAVAPLCTTDSSANCSLGLFLLHARRAGQANNILANNMWRLEPDLARMLPALDRSMVKQLPGGQIELIRDRIWRILSCLFKPVSDEVPAVLRTESWMSRRLESTLGAWVDSHLAVARLNNDTIEESPKTPSDPLLDPDSTGTHPTPKAATYHYLEPCPEIFAKVGEDARTLMQELTLLGYFPASWHERFVDFIRFAERLEKIADNELKGKPLTSNDWRLLAYIDVILQKIVTPTPGALTIKGPSQDAAQPLTFGVGHPALLYIILTKDTRTTLSRGALYAYYEQIGKTITHQPKHGLLELPWWTEQFDVMEPTR